MTETAPAHRKKGPKTLHSSGRFKRTTVTLDPDTVAFYISVSPNKDNLSEGIRVFGRRMVEESKED